MIREIASEEGVRFVTDVSRLGQPEIVVAHVGDRPSTGTRLAFRSDDRTHRYEVTGAVPVGARAVLNLTLIDAPIL